MLKINFLIIFFLFLFVLIDGIDEDFFDDLWKNLKPSTSKNTKKQKFGENNAIKEEKIVKDEVYDQQNAHKIIIKSEIKIPKIETEKLSEESVENEFDEQFEQNVSLIDLNKSAIDAHYNNMYTEEINEMEILMMKKLGQKRERTEESVETKMEVIRKFIQLKKERIYGHKYDDKQRSKIENQIANELGTNRHKIYKLKREFDFLNGFSMQQKIEKVKQFEKVKEEFTKKFNLKTNWEINEKIAKKRVLNLIQFVNLEEKIKLNSKNQNLLGC